MKKFKPAFFVACVALFLLMGNALSITTLSAEADTEIKRGNFGAEMEREAFPNLQWTLTPDGLLSISGSGEMEDFTDSAHSPWFSVRNRVTRVIIYENVKNIGEEAFAECDALKDVTIPVSVTAIASSAFRDCRNLRNVYYAGDATQWKAVTSVGAETGWLNPEKVVISFNAVNPSANTEQSGATDTGNSDTGKTGTTDTGNSDTGKTGTTDTGNSDTGKTGVTDTGNSATDEKLPSHAGNIEFPGYSFQNTAQSFGYSSLYRIPLNRYQALYGDGILSQKMYEADFHNWSGSVYGMAASAAMLMQEDSGVSPADFRAGAIEAGDLSAKDKSSRLNLSVTEFIEMMELSAKTPAVCKAALENRNHLSDLAAAAEKFQTTKRNPALILLSNGAEERALLCWFMDAPSDSNEARLYVYDPNFPKAKGKYVALTKDKEGTYISWRYALSAQSVLGTGTNDSLTFVPYSAVKTAWTNRGTAQGESVFLTLNAANATLYSNSKKNMAVIRNGAFVSGADNAYPMSSLSGVSLWLPNDVYTVLNEDTAQSQVEVRLIDARQSVTVSTVAQSFLLSVEDKTVSTFAQIPHVGCEYEVRMSSELDANLSEVRLRGVTNSDYDMTVFHYAGMLNILGAKTNATLYVNGEERAVDNYMIPPVGGGTVGSFADVTPKQYYYDAIQWAISKEITNGTSPTTFSPNQLCTHAHILTFLWRASGSPEPSISNPFSNVRDSAYYAKASAWAYEMGLLSGTEFRGNASCSRAEAMVYLWKMAKAPIAEPIAFQDVKSTDSYAQAISWGVESGITKGVTETTFAPANACTRGHIITFLYRYFVKP